MKPRWTLSLLLALALGAGVLAPCPSHAATNEKPVVPPPTTELPGREIAETLSTVTGVAISPLLGVSTYGAYHYWKTPPERRASLPWFARPWFWIPALVLVGMCLAKDTLGTAAPAVLKKPLDVADTLQHKITGLLAAGLFVPIVASIFGQSEPATASLSSTGLAMLDLNWLYNALMVPVAMVVFFIVFLASTAINILILLSPFTTVDAGLKLFRGALLVSVTASAFANPWLGAAWALVLILISALIAGWSFRLTTLGTLFIWDFVTLRRKRFTPAAAGNWMFLARKLSQVPTRTYGRLSRDAEGRLVFRYRPWLVMPQRQLTLDASQYAVGQGLFYSTILEVRGEATSATLVLPPRYRSHEEQIARLYDFAGVRPAGLRAVWRWFKDVLGFGTAPQPAAG